MPSIFPNIRVFSNESALHIRWPKYWSFSFSISPSNEYSGLISFRIGCFDLLAVQFSSVQFSLSVVSDSLPPQGLQHARPPCPSPTPSLLKLMSIEWEMPSNHLILCHLLLLVPSIFPSIRVFSNESALHIRLSQYWSFSFIISPSSEYSGVISFRIDWFDWLSKGLSRVFPNTTI